MLAHMEKQEQCNFWGRAHFGKNSGMQDSGRKRTLGQIWMTGAGKQFSNEMAQELLTSTAYIDYPLFVGVIYIGRRLSLV